MCPAPSICIAGFGIFVFCNLVKDCVLLRSLSGRINIMQLLGVWDFRVIVSPGKSLNFETQPKTPPLPFLTFCRTVLVILSGSPILKHLGCCPLYLGVNND